MTTTTMKNSSKNTLRRRSVESMLSSNSIPKLTYITMALILLHSLLLFSFSYIPFRFLVFSFLLLSLFNPKPFATDTLQLTWPKLKRRYPFCIGTGIWFRKKFEEQMNIYFLNLFFLIFRIPTEKEKVLESGKKSGRDRSSHSSRVAADVKHAKASTQCIFLRKEFFSNADN